MRKSYLSPSITQTTRSTLAASLLALSTSVTAVEGSPVTITANRPLAYDTTLLYRDNARFKVGGGVILPQEEAGPPPLSSGDSQTSVESTPWYEKLAACVLDFLVPPAIGASLFTNPGDIYITDPSPYIFWNDTDTTNPDWYTGGDSSRFSIFDRTYSQYLFHGSKNAALRIYDDVSSFYLYNRYASGASFYLDAYSGIDAFRADANGDIELADGAVFIDKSSNFLGVGTMTPTESIHVASTSPAIVLDSSSRGDFRIRNSQGELTFYRSGGSYNGYPLTLENDLSPSLYPGIGIWNTNPKVPLHVGSHDYMSAALLVENLLPPTAAGDVTMLRLENEGNKIVRFVVQAGGGTSIWTFDNEPTYNGGAGINSGRFRIAKSGTGVTEFSVDGYGNGQFHGTSYAVNHVNTSSRESKTDFVSLNEQEVLAQLMQLPVSEWRYKQESEGIRHVGPVAEDFKQAFGLGDGRHISTVDSDGIALAAIKAVKAEKDAEIAALLAERDAKLAALSAEKNAEIAALRAEKDAEIGALSGRLKALEDLLMN